MKGVSNMVNNIEEFINFIIKAKQNTYAGDGNKSQPSRPNSKDLHYKEGDLLYIDTYVGSSDFMGEEVVFNKGIPIWGMNYYGKMLVDKIPDGFINCLKNALINIPNEAPFRGPKIYRYEKFQYCCNWDGDIENFEGNEKILMNGIEVYKLKFHGGFLK